MTCTRERFPPSNILRVVRVVSASRCSPRETTCAAQKADPPRPPRPLRLTPLLLTPLRLPLPPRACLQANPFDVFRMFTSGDDLRTATTVMALHNLMDVKVMADPLIVLQMNLLEWARESTQMFSSVLGPWLLWFGNHTNGCVARSFGPTILLILLTTISHGYGPKPLLRISGK